MSKIEKQDGLKDIVSLFKEDYTTPTKLLVWAKTIKECLGIVFGVLVFGAIIAVFLYAFIEAVHKRNAKNQSAPEVVVRSAEPGSQDQQVLAEQKVAPHMKDLLNFLSVTAKSLNKRQEIFGAPG